MEREINEGDEIVPKGFFGMYLFNPWNDLALANFMPNYTPPASALRMANDLSILPIWYAGSGLLEGDGHLCSEEETGSIRHSAIHGDVPGVIAEGEHNRFFLEEVKQILPVDATVVSLREVSSYAYRQLNPWGWSPALRRKLLAAEIAETSLPSHDALMRLRDYSGRHHAVEVLHELQHGTRKSLYHEDYFCGESYFFSQLDALLHYLSSSPGDKVLKMPLSGSGKGLIRILGAITDKQCDWCRRVIREQGGVVAEPLLQRVQDLALEFRLCQGKAQFTGYSLFATTSSGAYAGNALMSNQRIEERIQSFIPIEVVRHVKEWMTEELPRRFPLYSGIAGVDMMICDTPGGYRIQPCVEINMRMNMGMVARIIHDRYVKEGVEGRFVVDYFKAEGGALLFHEKMQKERPLKVEDGKILSGYLSLVPVGGSTHYIAFVDVGEQ